MFGLWKRTVLEIADDIYQEAQELDYDDEYLICLANGLLRMEKWELVGLLIHVMRYNPTSIEGCIEYTFEVRKYLAEKIIEKIPSEL